MSVARVLERLSAPGAVLARVRAGEGYGVYPHGDMRRRPLARLSSQETQRLVSDGTIVASGEGFALSRAGRARLRREDASDGEGFAAQHVVLETREVVDVDGDVRQVRGVALSTVVRRLASLRDGGGKPWLDAHEIAAAERLRADWEAGQAGLVRGSDWSAAPMSRGSRGVGNAHERALAARCDAGRRVADALHALAQPLRTVVERVCLLEDGIEALERASNWPARSGKLALKLGLAQLAVAMARR